MSLIDQRREMVGDKTRFTNRLCNTLKQYYPQAPEWFAHIDTVLFCDFIARWPTLSAVKRAHRSTLEAFFHAHNCRRPRLIEMRLESIRSATPLTEDPGILSPCRLHALALVAQLRAALAGIDVFDSEIATVARTLPAFALFECLPGAGPHLTPRLLAAFGEQRERFRHAAELRSIPALRRSLSAVARNAGCTGAGNVRRACARPSWNGPARQLTSHSGRALTTCNSDRRAVRIRPPSGHWRSSGYGSSSAAGKHGHCTTRASI
ncbi:hypothetical protein OKW27_001196 [Paraburkholderia sp. 35.1]